MESVNRNPKSKRLVVSLMRMRSRAAHRSWLSRGFAAAMALSLLLAFTPCCEIFGTAYAASATEDALNDHASAADCGSDSHESDGQGGLCGKWLDSAPLSSAVSTGAFSPSWEGKAPIPLLIVQLPLMSRQAVGLRPLRSVFPPPRLLYLSFARLLL